jgi:hypothetical protein
MGSVPAPALADGWTLAEMVGRDGEGRPIYRAKPVPEALRNPISPEDEAAFQARARHVIAAQARQKVAAGNTYFENEKRTYGYLMAHALAGRVEAIRELQLEDAQAKEWHSQTAGIDFYAAFTLKHQVRKFFYFGDLLEPAYRQRMVEGAKAWCAQDPMKRPHPAFKKPGEGWGPDTKNSWVDVRSTENLYLMRVTSVYLFAEAVGNREVAAQYKRELGRYTHAMYSIGMGEWDSENYHGHSIGPLCNLYDFAEDEDVRRWAKAALDWVFAAGALKYYRGGFNGPTKRDYNHVQPFGGSAANMLWVHFGDTPGMKEGEWESDEVHLITSAYRPPAAVLQLARKHLAGPVEVLSAKPQYSATTAGDLKSPPEYLETQYLGRGYLMGSLASGTSQDGGDVNGFKILAFSEKRGADSLQCVPGPDPAYPGSPKYQKGKVSGPNRVGQFENLALWLVQNGKSPWLWVLPDEIEVSHQSGVTFLKADRTWVAIRGLATGPLALDQALTEKIGAGEKPIFRGHRVLKAEGQGERFCGLAVEVGEAESHGSFAEFQKQALAAEVDLAKLQQGIVQYKSGGKQLGLHWHDDPKNLGVWRNGQQHDWLRHAQLLYGAGKPDAPAPLSAAWGAGSLNVAAGGATFSSSVAEDGTTTFTQTGPK